ncbi:phosphoribosylanthranilate isomerase [Chryseobacterium oryctis]|uniref:N-(5'-phosphoribosyl)anthranilate isomerase n=1 Tax=Chryseobacterium oryctis TaxID=2952618 RepID=A0ABT3HMU0_9FLAO|nr:phosphoribosylanthranilate isomerase [Chryseobacterium oryctis]MCW3161069.1 phosphoribosylanthranilate isomerase [Chryseobacterium oryctis]
MGNQLQKLKVCGLTKPNQIHELISMNTDFLGFIFYEKSLRYALNHLSLDEISKIQHDGKVGVFVNENLEEIIEIIAKSSLNYIQLHGDEDEKYISELRKRIHSEIKIIKVIRIGNFDVITTKEEFINRLNNTIQVIKNDIEYLLFDTDSKDFGGTGKQFDWQILNEISLPLPYFLSGGISEENINKIEALKQKPFAIDINSKFEIEPGIKDLNRIKNLKMT